MEVSTAPDTTLITNTAATAYDGSTAMLTMTTAGATTANLGDHVELRLKDSQVGSPAAASGALAAYS